MELIELYKRVERIRAAEEMIASRYSEGKMRCPTHLSIGQEAAAVGVCAALRDEDLAVSTHRAHAHYLAKGGDLNAMVAEIYGKATGCSGGLGGSMHLTDLSCGFVASTAIVGGTIPIGVGLGYSLKFKGKDAISVVFVGDAAVEEGVFYESANFAAVHQLPVLFICENNLYSVYSPLNVRQPKGRKIYEMVKAIGLVTDHAYGNDVRGVCQFVSKYVEGLRKGSGPVFLELDTYRWREHCGPNYDNHIGYRTEEEFQEWKSQDPLVIARNFLANDGVAGEVIEKVDREVQEEVEQAFLLAEKAPFPDKATFQNVTYREAAQCLGK